MVKCTSCGNRWRAYQDRDGPEASPPEDDLLVEGPPVEAGPPPPIDDDLEIVAAPVTPARKPAPVKAKPRRTGMIVGLGLAATVAAMIGAGIILRFQVAAMVPEAAPLYAAIGVPVDVEGFVLTGVTSKPDFLAGRPVLKVTGAVRNTRRETLTAPSLRVSLLDKTGAVLVSRVAGIENGAVPGRTKRYFLIYMPDPPANAESADVGFEAAAKAAAHVAVPSGAHAPAGEPAHGAAPEPVEAQALPAGTPDALHAPEPAKHE